MPASPSCHHSVGEYSSASSSCHRVIAARKTAVGKIVQAACSHNSSRHACSAHLTPVRENFPTERHMYGELHLIRPICTELLYTHQSRRVHRSVLTYRVSDKCPISAIARHTQHHEALSYRSISSHRLSPLYEVRSTTEPTTCPPRPSILHAGRRLRSCCSTLVSDCSCSRVLACWGENHCDQPSQPPPCT